MIRKIFALSLAAVLALTPVQAFGKTVSITNVSYDPTREMFEQYNKIFEEHWKEKTGEDVEITQSHGGEAGAGGSQRTGCRCSDTGTGI